MVYLFKNDNLTPASHSTHMQELLTYDLIEAYPDGVLIEVLGSRKMESSSTRCILNTVTGELKPYPLFIEDTKALAETKSIIEDTKSNKKKNKKKEDSILNEFEPPVELLEKVLKPNDYVLTKDETVFMKWETCFPPTEEELTYSLAKRKDVLYKELTDRVFYKEMAGEYKPDTWKSCRKIIKDSQIDTNLIDMKKEISNILEKNKL